MHKPLRTDAAWNCAAHVVTIVHTSLILFMICAPFLSGDAVFHLLHLAAATGLIVHWLTGTDVCALTYLEAYLRGKPPGESFIYSIVRPVFIIQDATVRRWVLAGTVALGCVSAARLLRAMRVSNWI
jgi:hypothetical protein